MTREEFARLVRRGSVQAGYPISQESLEFAVEECNRRENMTEKYVSMCIELADSYDRFLNSLACQVPVAEATPDADEAVAFTSMLTTDDLLLTTDDLLQKLQPWVKSVRERLFHRNDAPFSSMNDAAAWIERTAQESWQASPEEKETVYRLAWDIREKLNAWRALTGLDWRDDGSTRFFFYRKNEEEGVKVVGLPDPDPEEEHPAIHSPSIELQHAAEHMADATGFYQDSLVTYILTDIPPVLPALKTTTSATLHDLTDIFHRQVTMEFLTGDVRK